MGIETQESSASDGMLVRTPTVYGGDSNLGRVANFEKASPSIKNCNAPLVKIQYFPLGLDIPIGGSAMFTRGLGA